MTAVLILGTGTVSAEAAPTGGVANYTSTTLISTSLPTAGVASALVQCMTDGEKEAVLASAQPQIEENDAPTVASEYADIAVATVVNYVNIRAEASEDSEKLGKLYANGVATVLDTEGDWYKVPPDP